MLINFALQRSIVHDLNLDRRMMAIIAVVLIAITALFGAVQKIRLDLLQKKSAELSSAVAEMREKSSPASVTEEGAFAKDAFFFKYEKRALWSAVLKRLSANLSERVWLSGIKKSEVVRNSVELSGDAADQGSVAEMVRSLKDVSDFKDIKLLSSASREQEGGRKSVSFIVLCELK